MLTRQSWACFYKISFKCVKKDESVWNAMIATPTLRLGSIVAIVYDPWMNESWYDVIYFVVGVGSHS